MFWMSIFANVRVLVTARDLALMAATLGERRGQSPHRRADRQPLYRVAHALCDDKLWHVRLRGAWIYRVGISGEKRCGRRHHRSLPAQFRALATFSPRLDAHGNSGGA